MATCHDRRPMSAGRAPAAREAAKNCGCPRKMLRTLADQLLSIAHWLRDANAGDAPPWAKRCRACRAACVALRHAFFAMVPPPAGRRSGDVVTADFF
ncbi:hypothetical protein F511_45583 [Dorcoceras hygrometricum]|uniref:Uncharacterized protein n=1 Tax=Dorcoceras hygrometricum TaxID=472368 RepID=A0A2Z6ZVM5_9LAMI|nr:hypothetical protein F511_45583 [Dorcoceras hygrometricum]